MNIVLHDLNNHLTFAPLTLTRPVGNLRTGMWTNDERWQFYFPTANISYRTEDYLNKKFKEITHEDTIWINAAVIADMSLVDQIKYIEINETLIYNDIIVAFRGNEFSFDKKNPKELDNAILLQHRWDLFLKNEQILKADFEAYTSGKESAKLSSTNTLLGNSNQLFIEDDATVECAILNVTTGPIYIGKGAEIMENTVVRGGLAMAEHSVFKLSSKVYGAVSIGPYCKVGGEVNNVIFQGYSNKGHDGFLGNAMIGEWCNLGADTNCSNLKNNYGKIKTYDYALQSMLQTDEQFMGVCMGDFSKTSINTMLNTATVIGVSANIFDGGFPPKFVPNFSWGGQENAPKYSLEKAFSDANAMMKRRGKELTDEEKEILIYLKN